MRKLRILKIRLKKLIYLEEGGKICGSNVGEPFPLVFSSEHNKKTQKLYVDCRVKLKPYVLAMEFI
jgi:hypothetical protein